MGILTKLVLVLVICWYYYYSARSILFMHRPVWYRENIKLSQLKQAYYIESTNYLPTYSVLGLFFPAGWLAEELLLLYVL